MYAIILFFLVMGAPLHPLFEDFKAFNAYQKHEYDKSIAVLQYKQIENPHAPELNYNLGVAHFRGGQYLSAVKDFERVVEYADSESPLRVQALYNAGNGLVKEVERLLGPDWEKKKIEEKKLDSYITDLERAVSRYSQAQATKEMPDAKTNQEYAEKLIEKLKEKKKQQQQNKGQDKDNKQDNKDKNKQDKNDSSDSKAKGKDGGQSSEGDEGDKDQDSSDSGGDDKKDSSGKDKKDKNGKDGKDKKDDASDEKSDDRKDKGDKDERDGSDKSDDKKDDKGKDSDDRKDEKGKDGKDKEKDKKPGDNDQGNEPHDKKGPEKGTGSGDEESGKEKEDKGASAGGAQEQGQDQLYDVLKSDNSMEKKAMRALLDDLDEKEARAQKAMMHYQSKAAATHVREGQKPW